MSIDIRHTKMSIDAYIDREIARRERSLIRMLNLVGIKCVNEARLSGDYMDQTGNLRSSTGYMVLKNGVVQHTSSFEKVKDGELGTKKGADFLREITSSNAEGYVLIVVAGMNYAAYVAANKNVLASAELLAAELVPKMLKELGFTRT